MSVKIIAEVGVNHNGNIQEAFKLITEAKRVGADAVKFQLFNADKLEPPGPRRDLLKQLELTEKEHVALKLCAEKNGLEYICTPFDLESLEFLVKKLKVKTLKISSGEIGNVALLEAAKDSKCDVIFSTGMSDREAITWAWSIIPHATIMHCVSAYPTNIEDCNLNVITWLKDSYPLSDIGFSDHSMSTVIPALAVALGAKVIEKHISLIGNWVVGQLSPDHMASLRPRQFADMVFFIRQAEQALGDGHKRPLPCEETTIKMNKHRKEYR